MTTNIQEVEQNFLEYVKKIGAYNEALALIYWDLRTGAPKKGMDQRTEVIGVLSAELFAMSTSDELESFLTLLSKPTINTELSAITKKTVEEMSKDFARNKKIPASLHKEYVMLQSKAESVWEEAKEKADFSLFQPYLEKLVEMTKQFIEYWGYKDKKYDVLLDMYEPGVTVDILDEVFTKVREAIVPLVQKISKSSDKPETAFLYEHFSKENQKNFSLDVLKQIGYDFQAGRLDETVHPFATGINPGDVRITTKYDESDFRVAVFGTIHEVGHALYEQNISADLVGTPLATGTSMGIHESQSLFYENFVGRNQAFWEQNYKLLKSYSNGQFDTVSVENFYRAINESKPSLIRIEADELTYPLHIMIRYEIEKGLFDGEYQVKDLPQIWNEKYEAYLGIKPEHDGEGVLQDVHWAGGSFGYFPSYALGYMYAAQFKQTLMKDLPLFQELLEKGDLLPIKQWFNEKVHQYGKMKKPLEILTEVTGEGLNAQYLIDYLTEKYNGVYHLND
ncbi:carboxypeptidase M32 [Bacillus sp. B1-b2]|uniref:carboxypeptidase M32 n=1 Tax=Bacillus sp. B1-b2 TaxID=2653201 RepID=UPI00126239AA|nr:carboxypeptidase M32 [Bacillus sp. B1-b2]KAB7672977.1 carboxypeptidase M32 [Bacillus sp. B1-b2]